MPGQCQADNRGAENPVNGIEMQTNYVILVGQILDSIGLMVNDLSPRFTIRTSGLRNLRLLIQADFSAGKFAGGLVSGRGGAHN